MDVQKLSGLPAASANLAPRPAAHPAEDSKPKAPPPEPSIRQRSSPLPPHVKLQLDIDPVTNTVIGRVVDKATGEIVRQIPSEEMIALKARGAELLALLDKKV